MLFLTNNPDLLIVDLRLADGDGKEFIKQIREISKIPILLLSARHDEKEIIAALDFGADGYITKPFSINEPIARVRAESNDENILEKIVCRNLEIDIASRDIFFKREMRQRLPKRDAIPQNLCRYSKKKDRRE